jgi:general nucleoside transport system ATP-binding protein
VAHRITVMRGGRVEGTTTPAETTEAQLATLMVGHETSQPVPATARPSSSEAVLCVQNLWALDDRGAVAVDDISFVVHAGDILGIAGVQGNGQTELVEILTGLRSAGSGRITIGGVDVTRATPRRIAMLGVAHIPEDRHRHGMVERYSIADNLVLNVYHQKPFAHGIIRRTRAIAEHAKQVIQAFDIRAPSGATPAGGLSGGNQQKMVVARELGRPLRLLVAAQPTRGLDVGATAFLHRQLIQKRDAGCAVLLVSAELDEILALSDRIAVIYRGKLLTIIETRTTSRESLGRLMAGLDAG